MFKRVILICTLMISVSACNSYSTSTSRSTEIRIELATEYLRLGSLDAAKRTLDTVLKSTPNHAIANMLMGVLLQQDGSPENMQKAQEYFQRAIVQDTQQPQIWTNYGRYLFQTKQYDLALKYLQKASDVLGYEQRFLALENLGRVYLAKADIENAEQSFLKALQINPRASVAQLELASLYAGQSKWQNAEQYYYMYLHFVGVEHLGERAKTLGVRIANSTGNTRLKQQLLSLPAQ